MSYGEAPESVKYHGGYDPSDPPQGEHWCSECGHWDDDCTCEEQDCNDASRDWHERCEQMDRSELE